MTDNLQSRETPGAQIRDIRRQRYGRDQSAAPT